MESIQPSVGEEEDFVEVPVPLDRRYGTFSMGLLWITMMTTFPNCLFGFEWYRLGFSFQQVLAGILVGASIVLIYTAASSYMGALCGLNYALLAKHVFGRIGAKVVCAAWSILFFLWYAYMAGSVAAALKGLLPIALSLPALAVVMAILMSINNLFGFKGVTNFARYLAAPCLIAWIAYTFAKACFLLPSAVLHQQSAQTWGAAFTIVSPLIVGSCIWGNEPDFWRFAKPQKLGTVLPILLSVIIGEILFPLTGWMVGFLGHVSEPSAAANFLNSFTFGSNGLLAATMLVVSYFAVNDGNLYGAINGFESIFRSKRGYLLIPLILMSCGLAVWLTYRADALDLCASFNAFLLPTVSIIIGIDYFFFRTILHLEGEEGQFKSVSWPAITALVIAWSVGVCSSGSVPFAKALHNGIWPLYAWLTAALVYLPLRMANTEKAKLVLVVPHPEHEQWIGADEVSLAETK